MAVESTGAASVGIMASPIAARQLMIPPPQQVLRAAPVPARIAAAPKVRPPARWGFYVLAFAEVAAEQFAGTKHYLKELGKAAVEEGPASDPLTPIDLAAPVPPAQPEEEDAPALFAPKPSEPQPVVVHQAAPEPKPAPVPAKAVPAVAPAVVTDPAAKTPEAPSVRRLVVEEVARGPVNDERKVVQMPRLTLAFKLRGEGFFGAGRRSGMMRRGRQGNGAWIPQKLISKMEGAWNQGRGIRYRIIYLDPVAFSQAGEGGFQYQLAGKFMANPSEKVPRQYWGTYPIYRHGQDVNYEIEVENTGSAPLRGVTILAAQEVFNPEGKEGARLPTETGEGRIALVKPGERVKVRNSFKVTSDWAWHGSLEQTHVKVAAGETILAQAYQAGIIDPPPDL